MGKLRRGEGGLGKRSRRASSVQAAAPPRPVTEGAADVDDGGGIDDDDDVDDGDDDVDFGDGVDPSLLGVLGLTPKAGPGLVADWTPPESAGLANSLDGEEYSRVKQLHSARAAGQIVTTDLLQ